MVGYNKDPIGIGSWKFDDFCQTLWSPERSWGALSQFCQSALRIYVSCEGFAAQNAARGPHEASKNKMDGLEVAQLDPAPSMEPGAQTRDFADLTIFAKLSGLQNDLEWTHRKLVPRKVLFLQKKRLGE